MLHRGASGDNLPDIADWKVFHRGRGTLPDDSWRLIWEDEAGATAIFAQAGSPEKICFLLWYDEVASFTLAWATREIGVSTLDDEVPDSTISHLLADQIWPRILSHRGELVLHAAGVTSSAGAILFVGQSGRGKSTLAASLHERGLALLGDDAMIISPAEGEARCRAVYRSLRLFPDSIGSLFDRPVHRSGVAEYTPKENIHLPTLGASREDPRVRAIFFIEPDAGEAHASVTPIAPGDSCIRLVQHSFWLDPTDKALTARKLGIASALTNAAPAYRLAYPRDYAKIGEVHAAIFSVLN